jgi:arginine decarboxylase
LKNDANLETSSGFDINIIESLYEEGLMPNTRHIICNGYKKENYLDNIVRLHSNGFENTICVFDNQDEPAQLGAKMNDNTKMKVGIRIASEEEPKFEFYTSRLGVGYKDVVGFYIDKIRNNPKFELKMLHFFINTGISDSAYYWNELTKCVNVYCALKKICPELDSLNIGGGLPIKNSLTFNYDYEYMAEEIIAQIKMRCNDSGVPEPHIFTEFGSFTVGESGAALYSVLSQKKQNDRENWNMIDSSFMTTLPDSWAISRKFIMLAVNNWEKEYERVLLGGLTCDSDDYYNAEAQNAIYLPKYDVNEVQYIGLFHTGAYQESIGGYGGIQHCLTPAPKHIIIDKDKEGDYTTKLFSKEQSYKNMLAILGY